MNINYYQKFIDFFERHELYDKETFDYLKNNTQLFDYRDTDQHGFIGCFYLTKKGILQKINLILPFIDSDITTLINIHEYTHGIIAYKKINSILTENIVNETLPLLYERIYLEENKDNENLREHINNLNRRIINSTDPESKKYKQALSTQDQLLDYYYSGHTSIKDLNKKAKKLIRKQN